jgi:hypothetical protein
MNNIPYWMPEFEKLFLKVIKNHSSFDWEGELQAFYQKFEGKEEYKSIRFKCEGLMSTIYHYTGFLEKSFEIDLRFLKENSPDADDSWATISRIVGTSDALNRTNEIIPYARAFLNTPDDNSNKKRIVLVWYARVFAKEENSFFSSFNHIVQNMESHLEEKPDPTRPFLEWIEYLNDKYFTTQVALNSLYEACGKANKEERSQLIKEYLASEPLKYDRERVKIYLKY